MSRTVVVRPTITTPFDGGKIHLFQLPHLKVAEWSACEYGQAFHVKQGRRNLASNRDSSVHVERVRFPQWMFHVKRAGSSGWRDMGLAMTIRRPPFALGFPPKLAFGNVATDRYNPTPDSKCGAISTIGRR